MSKFEVDWEGAYQEWKESGLSRRLFQMSLQFKKYVRGDRMPSEDTVRSHFRTVRDRLAIQQQNQAHEEPVQDDIIVTCTAPAKIIRLTEADLAEMGLTKTSKALRRVIVKLNDGQIIEFETANPEMFAIKALGCQVEGLSCSI
ncbi:MAG: hypothetical protein Q4E62_04240 [Sutterellaceae bacterium]|nr:hypothetical protein [Sutterellaceae bacterium]